MTHVFKMYTVLPWLDWCFTDVGPGYDEGNMRLPISTKNLSSIPIFEDMVSSCCFSKNQVVRISNRIVNIINRYLIPGKDWT